METTSRPSVSIIIPVYNTEKYLSKCVESVISQSYNDFEVLLINDGSTDSSWDICKKYEKDYTNIRALNKKNGGQNSAVLLGLKKCSGKYILFVDSDDWIEKDCLRSLVNSLEYNCSDISIARSCRNNDIDKPNQKIITSGVYSKEKIREHIYPNLFCNVSSPEVTVTNSRCYKLFKKELLDLAKGYFETSIKHGEDSLLVKPYILLCKRICYIDDIVYHYRTNQDSISNKQIDIDILQEEYISLLSSLEIAANELSNYNFDDQFDALKTKIRIELIKRTVVSDSLKTCLSNVKCIIKDDRLKGRFVPSMTFTKTDSVIGWLLKNNLRFPLLLILSVTYLKRKVQLII